MSTGLIDAERRLEHSRDDGAALVVTLDSAIVQTVVLGARPLTIGRLPENSLVLAAPDVSRQHAEVRLEGDGQVATVTDLGSSGGTSVAGTTLLPDQPFKLEDGMVIRIGPYDLTYVAASVAARTVVPSAPTAPTVGPVRQPAWSPISNLPIDDVLPPVPARPRFPAPIPATLRSQYLRHLPSIFDDTGLDPLKATGEPLRRPNGELLIGADGEPLRRNQAFLGRMLVIFEALWEPLEQRQDHVAMYFDPRTCPAEMLSWLAGWLDVTLDPHWPEDRRRSLLAEAMELFRWRGTTYGLTRMIEVSTGLTAVITDDAEPFVIRVRVSIPPSSTVRRDVIENLIREHKPAHVGYVLETS